MKKVSALINYDKDILLQESSHAFLEDAITSELGWLVDSGISVEAWHFTDNENEIRVLFDVNKLSLMNAANDTDFETAFFTESGWIQGSGMTLDEMIFVPEPEKINLHEFLEYFDFDYDIVEYDEKDKSEIALRKEKIEDGELSADDLEKPLFCFIDLQGAYLGGIDTERYVFDNHLVEKIIDRLDVYINDSVYNEFFSELTERNIDAGNMTFEEMWIKAKELDLTDGEVCYRLAAHIIHPESILVDELEQIKTVSKAAKNATLDEKIKAAEEKTTPNDASRKEKMSELEK